jgi:hypothetical protein
MLCQEMSPDPFAFALCLCRMEVRHAGEFCGANGSEAWYAVILMKLSKYILLLFLWAFLLKGTGFSMSPDLTDASTEAETPIFDAQSDPVFNNMKDWLAQIRTLGSPVIASKTFTNQNGVFYAAVSKTGPYSIGLFVYDTRSHSMSHIGCGLTDSKGKGLSFIGQGLICKDYKIVSPNGGGTNRVVYGSGVRLNPNYSGVANLEITTPGGRATITFNLK